jgi:hypothetical protein
MLRRGLSNRPTGAAALLLIGAAFLLNTASTRDHQNFVLTTLFGMHVKDALVVVQRTGVAVDRMIVSWGEMLENNSTHLGCLKKNKLIAQRAHMLKIPLGEFYNFIFRPETKRSPRLVCPKRNDI